MAYYGKGSNGQILTDKTAPNMSNFANASSGSGVNTLSDDTGTSITPSTNNIQFVGHINEQGSTKFSTVVAGTHIANINPMSSSRWIVDPLSFNGTHTTIGSALSSATSGDTIFIMPGTYTENLTLVAGVNLTAFSGDAGLNTSSNVIIKGKCTFIGSGTVTISGIQLQTNSDYLLSVTGSNSSNVNLINCFINANNNTGINSASSGNGTINLYYCKGTATSNNIFFQNSGSNIVIEHCDIEGSSTSDSTISAGEVHIDFSYITFGITLTSTGILQSIYTEFLNGITQGSTAAGTGIFKCIVGGISGGTASITIASSCSMTVFDCILNSTGTDAITGSGTLDYCNLTFVNNSTVTPGVANQNVSSTGPIIQLTTGIQILSGSGSPSGSITAPQGSLYLRSDGTTINNRAYINTNSGTGWAALTTAS